MWFEAVRNAVAAVTGASPRVLEPAAVTIRSQRCWNRRAFPFFLAPLAAWLVGILNIRSQDGTTPAPAWAAAFVLTILLCLGLVWFAYGFLKANQALKSGNLDAVTSDEPPDDPASGGGITPAQAGPHGNQPRRPFWWTVSAWAFLAIGLLAAIDTLACLYSRPANPTLYPGLAHLFAGIALLTLSRRWRRVALAALALALVAGAFIGIMIAISPEHGSVNFPALNLSFLAAENPRWAATGAVFLALVLIWPCYLLMSMKAKNLFGLAKPE